jgi:heme exporter protein C
MKKYILLGFGLVLMVETMYLVFIYVPTEREMGIVQRIFYIMVPVAWLSLLAFLILFIGSITYLVKRGSNWDTLAYSSAELGIIFTSLTLAVGSLWAKAIWGVWWAWDEPRLTATLVLWFIYLVYFLVRSFAGEESRGARFGAVVGIIGFIDIPIVILATSLWRGLHPPLIIFQDGIAPSMLLTLLISIAAFTTLYFLLLIQRVSMRNDEIKIKRFKNLSN